MNKAVQKRNRRVLLAVTRRRSKTADLGVRMGVLARQALLMLRKAEPLVDCHILGDEGPSGRLGLAWSINARGEAWLLRDAAVLSPYPKMKPKPRAQDSIEHGWTHTKRVAASLRMRARLARLARTAEAVL